jgi:hypothetical protein
MGLRVGMTTCKPWPRMRRDGAHAGRPARPADHWASAVISFMSCTVATAAGR